MSSEVKKGSATRFDRLRGQAISILGQAMTGQATPAELMEAAQVAAADRPWVLDVVQGVLRTRGRLERVLSQLALKKSPTGWLKRALWVGGYALMYQDRTAPAAVVSEIVDLVRSKEGNAPAAFTNAILRKWAEHASAFREMPFPDDAPIAEQAQWASLPEWWWVEWSKRFGKEEAARLCEASLSRPQIWLRARPDAHARLLTQGFEAVAGMRRALVPSAELLARGLPVTEWPGFAAGEWIVQDLSSQQVIDHVVDALGAEVLCGEGWDLCAAPGGKTTALAWERGESAQPLWASDLTARLPLLRNTLARTGLESTVQVHETVSDAVEFPTFAGKPAWVWLDAPCTSSGLIRRHPEVRWQLRQNDRDNLHLRQAQLFTRALESGAQYVVYSVCSLFGSEGEKQVQKMLAAHPEYKLHKEWSLPITAQHDGFYAALLKK